MIRIYLKTFPILPGLTPFFPAALNFFMWQSNSDYHYKPTLPSLWKVTSLQAAIIPANKTRLEVLFSRVLSGLCREISVFVSNFENEFAEGQSQNITREHLFLNRALPVTVDVYGVWVALPVAAKPQLQEYRFTFNSCSVWKDSFWEVKPSSGMPHSTFMVYPDIGILYVGTFDWLFSTHTHLRRHVGPWQTEKECHPEIQCAFEG